MLGYPFWPALWAMVLILTAYFWHTGARNALLVVFMGYVSMRLCVMHLGPEIQMHAAFGIWLSVGVMVAFLGYPGAGIAYLFSASLYSFGVLFGQRVETLSVVPIASDICAIIALSCIAWGASGGLGVAGAFDRPDRSMDVSERT